MFNIISDTNKKLALKLRKGGYSLSEISKMTGISKSTLSLHLRNVELPKVAKDMLQRKQFKSKLDSEAEWRSALDWSDGVIGNLSHRDWMIILAMIYWGEGTKKELNMINSDPAMIRVFVFCIRLLGVVEDDIQIGLRLFPNCNIEESKKFWSKTIGVMQSQINGIEFVTGSKKHKHIYGMCRVRVRKGGLYFKKIMSMISSVKNKLP